MPHQVGDGVFGELAAFARIVGALEFLERFSEFPVTVMISSRRQRWWITVTVPFTVCRPAPLAPKTSRDYVTSNA